MVDCCRPCRMLNNQSSSAMHMFNGKACVVHNAQVCLHDDVSFQIMEAASQVNLQIMEEKVPTIEEVKSLEVYNCRCSYKTTNDDNKKKSEEPGGYHG